ncbi:MAG TPA: signal peptidase I [Acidimicrobiia bacterium]|nr:signal peptidase I [Acidimicrobiia bacterium]
MTTVSRALAGTAPPARRYSKMRLTLGVLGRAWMWFVGACLLITILPMAFGWHPYVILTGSMAPNIEAGDIVLSSPDSDPDLMLGRVVVFEDPGKPDHVLTHRVIAFNDDATLTTKGDANPTPDSIPVEIEAVDGLGRLLVRYVGLPVVWARTGNWAQIVLHLALIVGAMVAAAHDYEPEDDEDDPDSPGTPEPVRRPTLLRQVIQSPANFLGLVLLAGLLLVPTTGAAFTASTTNSADTWSVPNWSYTTEVNALAPYLYWKLDETGIATTAADSSGNGRTGTYNPSGTATDFTRLADGALVTDTPDRAVQLGANACINTTSTTPISAPQVFTVITWFRAPASYTNGGKLIGFERPQTGTLTPTAGAYDRHIYMDGNGRIWFGVYNGAHIALSSATGLNDNQWHLAVGTQSASGMVLYIDGAQVATNTNTVAETQTGWWRAGCGNLSGWGAQWGGVNNPGTDSAIPQNRVFAASLDEIAVFSGTALSPQQVSWLYWTR